MGEIVFAKCDPIFRDLKDLADQMRGHGTRCEGPLRIGASDHLANYILPETLFSFHRKYPDVMPNVYTGTPTEIVSRILERDLELGIFFTRIEVHGIEYQKLTSLEFVAVYHPTKENRFPSSPGERKNFLNHLGFIGSRSRDYRKQHPAQNLLESMGMERRLLLETNNQETQKRLCKMGYGYAVLPLFMVKEELKSKELVIIPGPRAMMVDVLLAKRSNHLFSRPAKLFMDKFSSSLNTHSEIKNRSV